MNTVWAIALLCFMESTTMNLPPLTKQTVAFGYTGIELVDTADLDKAQLGYSVHPDGHSLTGTGEGDWRPEWVVIGYEISLGDPIFIDTCKAGFPVYMAARGQGSWDPDLISATYDGFLKIIEKLRTLATDREYPVALEEHPMTQREFAEFVAFAKYTGGLEETFFWELMIQDEDAGIGPDLIDSN